MGNEQFGLLDLVELFPSDEAAERWFEDVRWLNGRACPDCGSLRTTNTRHRHRMLYRCQEMGCRHYFSVRKGTAMQSSKLGYQI